jgi:hypothetical protein
MRAVTFLKESSIRKELRIALLNMRRARRLVGAAAAHQLRRTPSDPDHSAQPYGCGDQRRFALASSAIQWRDQDGYVWGRGAQDMKDEGMAQLVAMVMLKRERVALTVT